MNRLPVMTEKEFYGHLLRYGCIPVSSEGSHFKVKSPNNGAVYPIPVHGKRDIQRGFMKVILTKLGIDIDEFIKML